MGLLHASFVVMLGILSVTAYKFWDDLQVTNYNSLMPSRKLPRTTTEALSMGWSKQDSECGGNKNYQGYAWADSKLNDAIGLLFDYNGYVAGMQARIPKQEAQHIRVPSPAQMPPFMKDPSLPIYYVIIYFVHPDKICANGRSPEEFFSQGTGSDLYIKNGDELLKIPKFEKDMKKPWVVGKCYITLGFHYWYNIHKYMCRDALFPIVPIYNGLDLNGFAIAYTGPLKNSIYGHPKGKEMERYMMNVPPCLKDSTFSMYYIFFTSNLWLNFC